MNDKSNIPRTNDSHPSGDVHKRVDNSDSGIVAPDSDGLVCEQCGGEIEPEKKMRICVQGEKYDKHGSTIDLIACVDRCCPHCYEFAVPRIKNILGKVV